jgi:hypothetical protein
MVWDLRSSCSTAMKGGRRVIVLDMLDHAEAETRRTAQMASGVKLMLQMKPAKG